MKVNQQQESVLPADLCGQRLLFSIGYGARSLEQFLALLASHRIEVVLDVRSAPYSKFKPDFSKELLQYHLERAAIGYRFMGDTLGGQPKEPACLTDGKIDYTKLSLQPFFQKGLQELRQLWEQPQRLVLMCSEGRPEQCHRSKLIGQALAAANIPLCHIDEDGALLSQAQVLGRLTQGQMELFGQASFTSRKRYGPSQQQQQSSET